MSVGMGGGEGGRRVQSMLRETLLDTATCQEASAGSGRLAGLTIVHHPGTEPVISFASSTFPLDTAYSYIFSDNHRSLWCVWCDRCFEGVISSSGLQTEKLA